jgi:hypothetical protein
MGGGLSIHGPNVQTTGENHVSDNAVRANQDLAVVSGCSNGRSADQDCRMSWNHAGFLR